MGEASPPHGKNVWAPLMTTSPKISELPSSARTIAEVIGVEQAFKLSHALFRGNQRKLYVPTLGHMTEHHDIARAIGFEQACRLAAHFGGDQIYIPSPYAAKCAAVWSDFMADMPVAEIAAKHGISERHVRRITAEERPGYDRKKQCREIAKISTPAKAAAARRFGTLGGSKNTMISEILSKFKREPATPYGALFTTIRSFSPKLYLLLSEDKVTELTVERTVELMVPCLPAELTIKYGDTASLMILRPAKNAQRSEPLMIRVETPITPKSMSQNSVVIAMLEALAVSAVIDKMGAISGQPKPTEARN